MNSAFQIKSYQHPHSVFFACVLSLLTLLMGGCSSQATHEGMTPEVVDVSKKHPRSVSLRVTGGKLTDFGGAPQISDAEFKQALLDAINKTKIFSGVIEGNPGDYLLNVILFTLEQPLIGLSFTVKMEAGWTLKRISDGVVVWQESIKSEHTATVGDAFAAVTRLRVATEGAAKNNISQGLSKISKLGTL